MSKEPETEIVAAVTRTVTDKITELHEQLRAEQAAGRKPTDDKVLALETQLTEAHARLVELTETVRLSAARMSAPANGNPQRAEEERLGAVFKGAFITDLPELKKRMQMTAMTGDHTRAIDSALFSAGGKLNAEQAEQFIDYIISQQIALSRVTTRRMNSPQGLTDEIRVAGRKLRKATEATAPSLANAVTLKRRTLTNIEVIWAEDITLTFLEDNIERAGAEAHIARLLGNNFGNDLNDLAWNGDENINSAGAEPFLTINNGWFDIALADSDVTKLDFTLTAFGPFSGSSKATDALKFIFKSMPAQFKGRTDHIIWTSIPFAEAYANEVSVRLTALGDTTLISGLPSLRYFGVPVVPEPHFLGNQADRMMMTPAANLFHGIQRAITVDSQWQPRKRVVEYTITARNDYEYGTGVAIVTADGLPAQLR